MDEDNKQDYHKVDDAHQKQLQFTKLQISDSGIKNISNIDYKNRFKGINWTSDPMQELPIKIPKSGSGSEQPLTLC